MERNQLKWMRYHVNFGVRRPVARRCVHTSLDSRQVLPCSRSCKRSNERIRSSLLVHCRILSYSRCCSSVKDAKCDVKSSVIFDSLQLLAIATKHENTTKYASYEATVQPTLKRNTCINGIETRKSYPNEFVSEKEQFFKEQVESLILVKRFSSFARNS